MQRAVWRKRGRNSSESEQVTSSLALVPAFVNPPPAAKPLGRYRQAGRQRIEEKNGLKLTRKMINENSDKKMYENAIKIH